MGGRGWLALLVQNQRIPNPTEILQPAGEARMRERGFVGCRPSFHHYLLEYQVLEKVFLLEEQGNIVFPFCTIRKYLVDGVIPGPPNLE